MSYKCNLSGMCWPVRNIIYWWVMLCDIISQFFSARVPVESEFPLDHAAAHPMEYHVHGLGELGYNGAVGESHGSGIFGLDGCLPLGPFHFYEGLSQVYHVLGGDKNSS